MKKSTLLLAASFAFFLSCSDEDIFLESVNEVGQVTGIAGEQNSDEVFLVVEEAPAFPGGAAAWAKFLEDNLNYPEQAKNEGIEGSVFLSFVVNKDGALNDVQITRGIGAGCDAEAIRVLQQSPNWTPGLQRGRAVNARMAIRITFKL